MEAVRDPGTRRAPGPGWILNQHRRYSTACILDTNKVLPESMEGEISDLSFAVSDAEVRRLHLRGSEELVTYPTLEI